MSKKEFKGVIKLDVRDSTPDWEPFVLKKATRRRTECADRALRRQRSGCLVAVRRRDQYADTAEAGRSRADVFAMAQDRALFADTLGVEFIRDKAGPHGESLGKAKL